MGSALLGAVLGAICLWAVREAPQVGLALPFVVGSAALANSVTQSFPDLNLLALMVAGFAVFWLGGLVEGFEKKP